MGEVIKVIRGKRYRLSPEEANFVDSVRRAYHLKCKIDKLKIELEQESSKLIKVARWKRGEAKSAILDGIDIKIRVEFPETHGWDQSKLEETAREYGAAFFEFFQSHVSYTPLPKLNLLLAGKVSQGNEALAGEIRAAKVIKQGKPKLRFIEVE